MTLNVISTIVKNELCIGCGVCAAICPDHTLEMRFNRFGEYNPFQEHECTKECGLCLKVCPFADGNPNEDVIGKNLYGNIPGILHRPETGYYLESYVGFAPDTREHGASGGMATWFLSTLLKEGIVDYVIAVVPNNDPDRLFKFTILSTPESVLDSAGSAYYPVELSGVLKEIQNNPGKCAIIGLPCFIKAIRLATLKNKKLRQKILVTAGLVCGQMKSKHFTEYISALSGVQGSLKKVHYRGKSPEQPSSNFYFSFWIDGSDKKKLFWNDGISEAWVNRWFTPHACNFCDDIFAECADITFMDAWLPKYVNDPQGTNLAIVRSPSVRDLLRAGSDSGALAVHAVPMNEVIRSQAGVISYKRGDLKQRLSVAQQQGHRVPRKRVEMQPVRNPLKRWYIRQGEKMQRASHRDFTTAIGSGALVCDDFRKSMARYLDRIRLARSIFVGLTLPVRVVGRMIRGNR